MKLYKLSKPKILLLFIFVMMSTVILAAVVIVFFVPPKDYYVGMKIEDVNKILSKDHLKLYVLSDYLDDHPTEDELQTTTIYIIVDLSKSIKIEVNGKNEVVQVKRVGLFGFNGYRIAKFCHRSLQNHPPRVESPLFKITHPRWAIV